MSNTYLTLCVILVVVLMACIALLLRSYVKMVNRNLTLRESVENLGKLNDKLRMDRHDYLNHLQVIYGLMELEEYEEMNAYLRKVYKELNHNLLLGPNGQGDQNLEARSQCTSRRENGGSGISRHRISHRSEIRP